MGESQKNSLTILPADSQGSSGGISRRKFLKVLGAASTAAGVSACADSPAQKILPNVKGDPEQIPGVAVWYNSTCTECTAGCGISVRTREGRAVKIEGNPAHPVNRGGLCALGQSALQGHYDPDRVRQPLKKTPQGFVAISWQEAHALLKEGLNGKGKKALLSCELSGAVDELAEEWSSAFKADRVVFDPAQPVTVARASELVYGAYGIPHYRFDRAEVVLNFGADFLETWISPCEFARDWASNRRSQRPNRVFHVEPRLSLTGANADSWLCNAPGSEGELALAVLKTLLELGRGQGLESGVRQRLVAMTDKISLDQVAHRSGVSVEKILLVANALHKARASLVIAGGASASTTGALGLQVICAFLNLVLENVGKSVILNQMRKPRSSTSALLKLVEEMKSGAYGVVVVYNSNPVHSAPADLAFKYARNMVPLFVSFSSHLDETSSLADLVLPASSSLESWGDSRWTDGVYGLIQPSMTPIFDTRSLGDIFIESARAAGQNRVAEGRKDFAEYLRASWEKVYASVGTAGGFQKFWLESLERGGYYRQPAEGSGFKIKVSPEAFAIKGKGVEFANKGAEEHGAPILMPYFSVKSFDGRAANRPWMQELPDPITQIVWDSWVEIHPDTARDHGIAQGDMVTVRNFFGEINVPAYLTEYIHKDLIAVPIGQGRSQSGRYAEQVGGGNVVELLSAANTEGGDAFAALSSRATLLRGRGRGKLVHVDGSKSQLGRELARTDIMSVAALAAASSAHEHDEHAHGDHHEHHEPRQMYVQRGHPLYKWAMAVDLTACTGCSACVVACYAENNIAVVGKKVCYEEREMSWLRIDRYYEGQAEELVVQFMPMMCQQCGNAPCEPVCPVYATYHNEEGLNAMIYNRCVGTRYCSNNCSYKVRRFNWYEYEWPETYSWQLNPDVTKRAGGVMEKCTFCVQRIVEAKDRAKDLGRKVEDGEVKPACVQSCPTQALTFGDLNDPRSRVSKLSKDKRAYKVLDHHLNTQPSISYLNDVKYRA